MEVEVKHAIKIGDKKILCNFARDNFVQKEISLFGDKFNIEDLYYFNPEIVLSSEIEPKLQFFAILIDKQLKGTICFNTTSNKLVFFIVKNDELKIESSYYLFKFFIDYLVKCLSSVTMIKFEAFLSQSPLYKALGFTQVKEAYKDEKSGIVLVPMQFLMPTYGDSLVGSN